MGLFCIFALMLILKVIMLWSDYGAQSSRPHRKTFKCEQDTPWLPARLPKTPVHYYSTYNINSWLGLHTSTLWPNRCHTEWFQQGNWKSSTSTFICPPSLITMVLEALHWVGFVRSRTQTVSVNGTHSFMGARFIRCTPRPSSGSSFVPPVYKWHPRLGPV